MWGEEEPTLSRFGIINQGLYYCYMSKSLRTPQYEHFRSLLVKARESAGLTQIDIAARLNRPQSFVAKYEGGERRLDVIEFIEVCNALGVNPNVIIAQLLERKEQ